MSILATLVFLGAIVAALVLAWTTTRSEFAVAADIVKQVWRETREPAITITYPAETKYAGLDVPELQHAGMRRHRPRFAKMPSHRLHTYPRPRCAA